MVMCTLVRALRHCTGRTAYRGSRGIALLFHDHGTKRGWGVSVTPRPLFTPGKDPVPIVPHYYSYNQWSTIIQNATFSKDWCLVAHNTIYSIRYSDVSDKHVTCTITIHPSMALHPLPGLGLPHKTPPFISICSSSPPSSYPQQNSASLWTTSAHLVLGLPTGLVIWKFPFRTFFGIFSSYHYNPDLLITKYPQNIHYCHLISQWQFISCHKLYHAVPH